MQQLSWLTSIAGMILFLNDIHSQDSDTSARIAAVPSYPGLRRFPEGRGFKQWTGDDSKALMKVYLTYLPLPCDQIN